MITTEVIAALLTEAGLTVTPIAAYKNALAASLPNSLILHGFYLNIGSSQLESWSVSTKFDLSDPSFPEKIKAWMEKRIK